MTDHSSARGNEPLLLRDETAVDDCRVRRRRCRRRAGDHRGLAAACRRHGQVPPPYLPGGHAADTLTSGPRLRRFLVRALVPSPGGRRGGCRVRCHAGQAQQLRYALASGNRQVDSRPPRCARHQQLLLLADRRLRLRLLLAVPGRPVRRLPAARRGGRGDTDRDRGRFHLLLPLPAAGTEQREPGGEPRRARPLPW